MNKLFSAIFLVGTGFFIRDIVTALRMGPGELEAGAWTFISACLILTGLVVVFIEWTARLHHRNICRDVEVRVRAVEEQS